jgi:hypothetical protein
MMNWTEVRSDLRFERRRTVPQRLIAIGGILAIFTLLWVVVPHGVLYWLGLFLLALLAWVASYGWREWLVVMIDILHRLERL